MSNPDPTLPTDPDDLRSAEVLATQTVMDTELADRHPYPAITSLTSLAKLLPSLAPPHPQDLAAARHLDNPALARRVADATSDLLHLPPCSNCSRRRWPPARPHTNAPRPPAPARTSSPSSCNARGGSAAGSSPNAPSACATNSAPSISSKSGPATNCSRPGCGCEPSSFAKTNAAAMSPAISWS